MCGAQSTLRAPINPPQEAAMKTIDLALLSALVFASASRKS